LGDLFSSLLIPCSKIFKNGDITNLNDLAFFQV
jgi:hypothetical protein